jgi:hypothetical protein
VSRRRVDGLIVPEGEFPEKHGEREIVQPSDENTTLYYVMSSLSGSSSEVEERRALSRLSILTVYHGITYQQGVPPSFTGSSSTLYSSF